MFLPFEQNRLPQPQEGERFIAFGLKDVPDSIWQDRLDIIQPWRPDYLRLEKAGLRVFPEMALAATYDGGFLVLDKHRRQNENRFLHLLRKVRPGGQIIVCGDKTAGGASLRRWAGNIVTIKDSLAKNHAVIFWFDVPEIPDINRLAQLQNPHLKIAGQFETAPGMFSCERIDPGSALLAKHLPEVLNGTVADFGAGWGYLAAKALLSAQQASAHGGGMTELDLYEADFQALAAARHNLAHLQRAMPIHYHWCDLASEQPVRMYDTVITNPPFHRGRMKDVTLGRHFIHTAARFLDREGKLLLVANRQLPYEAELNRHFHTVQQLGAASGFKVILARR